ncbi:MAG: polysaccharide biosynthesis/export family protein [Acidobacteria bacterium]|nr:polysaccharide biosynthesis/export family protein [Acidobacteriota bacterium]
MTPAILRFSALLALAASATAQAIVVTPSSPTGPSTYTLGPGDQIIVKVLDLDELSPDRTGAIRIDARGDITLPLVGRVPAEGLTTDQFALQLATRFKKFLHEPDVTVSLLEMRSQPISVLGAVQQPGVHQLMGRKTLFEVISIAGGLRQDAGHQVKITRRLEWGRIPLRDAQDDATGRFSVASVSVRSVMDASRPDENIEIKPNDVISVPRAELVYVVGAVKKAGGYILGEHEQISALQALSLAEGLDRASAPGRARIMRAVPNSSERQEIPVDLKKVMAGRGQDLPLKADDILFIPTSAGKVAALRSIEAAIQVGTGMAIYGRL